MRNICLGIATAIGMFGWGLQIASADEIKMTGEEIQKTLIGNSSRYDTAWGFAEAYRDPDGTFWVRNSKGERGKGKWSIKDDQLCLQWTETYRDWKVSDSCTEFFKVDDNSVKTSKGVVNQGCSTLIRLPCRPGYDRG
jgi:hypothetical protein